MLVEDLEERIAQQRSQAKGLIKVGVGVGSDLDLLSASCFLRHGCLFCPEFFYLNVSG